MNLFENILLDMIYILFPLMMYLIYKTYAKALNKEKSHLFLDIAIISSTYLLIKFSHFEYQDVLQLFLNIPLLIAYAKNRKFSVVIVSLSIIYYYNTIFGTPVLFLALEYTLYFVIYIYMKYKEFDRKKYVPVFLYLKMFLCTLGVYLFFPSKLTDMFELLNFLILLLSFFVLSDFAIYLFIYSEKIVLLHRNIEEVESEKNLTESLFKITHEIKNPIAVCKGYLDMFDVHDISHSERYVPILKSEISRLLILLEDFLSINRIKVNKEIMDINMLLEEVLKKYIPILKDRNIEYSFLVTSEELFIVADYNRLNQVFLNLIKNSIESIPSSKKGILKIYTKMRMGYIKIFLEDNGTGISKSNMEKMKEPFFSTKNRGTGLGVFLSNEIVKAHNGMMRYSSKEGKGTRVVITLPLK